MSNSRYLLAGIAGLALQGYGALGVADPAPAEATVVATGLLSPRGLDFAPNGELYVAESGVQMGPADPSQPVCYTGGFGSTCYTQSGLVSRIDLYKIAEHARVPVVTGLPTLGDVGPADISFFGMQGYVAIGLGSDPLTRTTLSGLGASKAGVLGSVIRFNPAKRGYSYVADISEFERSYDQDADGVADGNPDGAAIDSNPFGIAAEPGRLVVADAGGNDLIAVRTNGKKRLLAVFPAGQGGDRVPSRVTVGPDGYLYVGEEAFGAGAGQAHVYRVPPNGCYPIDACDVYQSGFTNVMDLELDRKGNLYVLEYGPGDLVKIDRHGQRSVVYSGLRSPGGLALSPDGSFAYVTNRAVCYGVETTGFDGKIDCVENEYGEVLRIPLYQERHPHGR